MTAEKQPAPGAPERRIYPRQFRFAVFKLAGGGGAVYDAGRLLKSFADYGEAQRYCESCTVFARECAAEGCRA